MRVSFTLSLIYIVFPALAFSQVPIAVHLAPGQTREFQISRGARVQISNGRVVQALANGERLQLLGKKMGTSTLIIQDGGAGVRSEIRVLNNDMFRHVQAFERALEAMRGLRVEVQPGALVVTGRLLRWDDWLSLAKLPLIKKQLIGFRPNSMKSSRRKLCSTFSRNFRRLACHRSQCRSGLDRTSATQAKTQPQLKH